METATVETKYGTLTCLKNDSIYTDHLAKGEYWDGDIIEKRLMPFIASAKVILDIGGHVGTHAVAYGKINPDAKIYTFEPQPHIHKLNAQNTSSNPNITSIHACVGQKCQTTHLLDHSIDGAAAGFALDDAEYARMNYGGRSIGPGNYECKMITIDSLNLEACDFIKMDIEGAEPLAILGAMETIKKFRPVIFFESNSKKLFDFIREAANVSQDEKILEARTMLEELGYKIYVPIHDLWCLNYLTASQPYPTPEEYVTPPESVRLAIECFLEDGTQLSGMMKAVEELQGVLGEVSCVFNSNSPDSIRWAGGHNSWKVINGTESATRLNMWSISRRLETPGSLSLVVDASEVKWELLVPSFLRLLTRPFPDVDAIGCNHLGVHRTYDTSKEVVIPRHSSYVHTDSVGGGAVLYLNNVVRGSSEKLPGVIDPDFITDFVSECSGEVLSIHSE